MRLPTILRCPRCESEVRQDVAHLPHDGVWPVGWQGYRTERGPCSWTWPRHTNVVADVVIARFRDGRAGAALPVLDDLHETALLGYDAPIPPEVQAAMARGR